MDGKTNQNSFRNPELGVEIRTDGRWLRDGGPTWAVLSYGPGGDHPLIIRPPSLSFALPSPISPSHSDLNGKTPRPSPRSRHAVTSECQHALATAMGPTRRSLAPT